MNKRLLLILITISAILAMAAQQLQHGAFYFLKPLTTILIIYLAWQPWEGQAGNHVKTMLAALVFCLFGDLFLLEDAYFVYGLGSFLFAHLIFAWIFLQLATVSPWSGKSLIAISVLIIISLVYFQILRPHLGQLQIPVAVYIGCIMFMCWQAIRVYLSQRGPDTLVIAMGALLFVFSDSIIALNKFLLPFSWSGVVILSTYWAAITLLALHVTRVRVSS